MNRAAYTEQLLSLLPTGAAWPRQRGTTLYRLAGVMAGELARVDANARLLEAELDPNTTDLALPDWERVYGLPDACAGEDQTVAGRRERLMQRITTRGGQSRPFFIGLAAALGYDIAITEFDPFSCEGPCDAPLYSEEWAYAFRVDAPEVTIRDADAQMSCDDPLRSWGNEVLECALRRRAHSHLVIQFAYGDQE